MSLIDPDNPAINVERLYDAAQTRALDRCAIDECGIPGIVLMKRAGRATFAALRQRWPTASKLIVFCGSGNNAGDGYIVAALAAEQQLSVTVVQVGDPDKLTGDARRAYDFAIQASVPMQGYFAGLSLSGDDDQLVIVDAVLGTGVQGEVRGHYRQVIHSINSSGRPVISVDIPSGLSADTGASLGCCVEADLTTTFIGFKQGLLTGDGPAVTGDIVFDDLGVPDLVYQSVPTVAKRLDLNTCLQWLPQRPVNAHKGHFGHVLVIGGDHGMGGAVVMAAEAAARTGAGLVSVATRAEYIPAILARRPELMVAGVESASDIAPLLARASVIVVGPGLGRSEWSRQLLKLALSTQLPMVIDADGLNLFDQAVTPRQNWILTPHPGEAARLLHTSTAGIAENRFAAATAIHNQYGGVVILKGSGSIIVSESDAPANLSIAVSTTGNPGMATGGMGDVLSGVLGGLLAQHLSVTRAAELGAVLHGAAADLAAANQGQRGLLATDLFPYIRKLVNQT